MNTPDFFCVRLDQMIDLRHPLALLGIRDALVGPGSGPGAVFCSYATAPVSRSNLLDASVQVVGAGISAAGQLSAPVSNGLR